VRKKAKIEKYWVALNKPPGKYRFTDAGKESNPEQDSFFTSAIVRSASILSNISNNNAP